MGIDREKVVDEKAFNKFANRRLVALHPDKYQGYEEIAKLDDAVKKFNSARDKIVELLRGGGRPPPIPPTPKTPRPPPAPRQPRQPQEPRQPTPPRPRAQGTRPDFKPKDTERKAPGVWKASSKKGMSEETKRKIEEVLRQREASKRAEEAELRASLAREEAKIRAESLARQEAARQAIEKERLEAEARAEAARLEIGKIAKEREQRLARKKRAVTPPLGANRDNKKLKDSVPRAMSAVRKRGWARRIHQRLMEDANRDLRNLEIVRRKQMDEIAENRYQEAVRKALDEYRRLKKERLARKRKFADISKMLFSAGNYYEPRSSKMNK